MPPKAAAVHAYPMPGPALGERRLPIIELQQDWLRLHLRAHGPLYYGKRRLNRFDDPDGAYGVLYLGQDLGCCLAEVLLPRLEDLVLAPEDIAPYAVSVLRSLEPLRLVDLSGDGVIAIGADASLATGPHAVSRCWSAALYAHPDRPDGIYYRARSAPGRLAAAVFERASAKLAVAGPPAPLWEGHSQEVLALFEAWGVGLEV